MQRLNVAPLSWSSCLSRVFTFAGKCDDPACLTPPCPLAEGSWGELWGCILALILWVADVITAVMLISLPRLVLVKLCLVFRKPKADWWAERSDHPAVDIYPLGTFLWSLPLDQRYSSLLIWMHWLRETQCLPDPGLDWGHWVLILFPLISISDNQLNSWFCPNACTCACGFRGAGRPLLGKSRDPTKALLCYKHIQGTDSLKAEIAAFFNEVLWAGSVMLGSHPYGTVTGVAAMDKFPIDIFCAGIKVSLH